MAPGVSDIKRILTLFLTLCVSDFSFTQVPEASTTQKIIIQGRDGKRQLSLNFPRKLRDQAPLLRSLVEKAFHITEENFRTAFRDDFFIYFDSEMDFHNGLATVIPNDRISIHLESPFADQSIGFGRDYLLETLVHEMAHLLSLQARSGLFQFFSYIVGNGSRPNGLWPRWIHEGLAVWSEGSVGGRPQSGLIEFDQRRYREFAARSTREPLESPFMDGSEELERMAKGQVPYSFGYLLVKKIFEKIPPENFVHGSSKSLGLSFRKTLQNEGQSVDELFAQARREWQNTPLLNAANSLPILRSAEVIEGPFSGSWPSWIEKDKQNNFRKLVAWDGSSFVQHAFHEGALDPLQNFYLPVQKKWIVLAQSPFRNPQLPTRKKIFLVGADGRRECEFPVDRKIREIFVEDSRLYTLSSSDTFFPVIEEFAFTPDCSLTSAQILWQGSIPFERVSSLFVAQGELYFSQSQGRNSYAESLKLARGQLSGTGPLFQPLVWNPDGDTENCIYHELSPEYFGPVWLQKKGEQILRHRFPLQTGSSRSALGPQKLLIKEELWDKDQILVASLALAPADGVPATDVRWDAPTPEPEVVESHAEFKEAQDYRVFPSLWPHFWTPSFMATQSGYQILGESFSTDLKNRYAADFLLGYDSETQRPLLSAGLTKNRLSGVPFDRFRSTFHYRPTLIDGDTQNRYLMSEGFDRYWSWEENLYGRLGVDLQFHHGEKTAGLNGYTYLSPGTSVQMRSPRGHLIFANLPELPLSPHGWNAHSALRFFKQFEQMHSLNAHTLLNSRLESQVHLQYALTGQKNFPVSYFEWGGLNSITGQEWTFLSRGFPPRFGLTPEIFRLNLEQGFRLWKINQGLSWNRFRLRNLDVRAVFETLTWNSYVENSRYALGRQYFSSAGLEWDLSGRAVQYVLWKLSLGYFHGFGPLGEDRTTLSLKSFLDL